jgi:hypothetical protein
VANSIYGLPREAPPPPPYVLQLGLDWLKYHIPPRAGGLEDQPMRLMRDIRAAVNSYHAIQAYRSAQQLNAEAQQKWYAANADVMKFMEYLWSLQDNDGSQI